MANLRQTAEDAAGVQSLPAGEQDGHASDSSDSSHSSHSSYAERHGMKGVQPPSSILPPLLTVLCALVLLAATQTLALWLFTKGFLLTRTELAENAVSSCTRVFHSHAQLEETLHTLASSSSSLEDWETNLFRESECTLPPRYNRSLIFVVDALRYDFIAPAPSPSSSNTPWPIDPRTQGVVQSIKTTLERHPQNSFVAHFAADPPTTTLQRLKALMTGVLPTFIDAGSNFGATEIGEDNLLSQLRTKLAAELGRPLNASLGMAFAGDDTWMNVFPTAFDQDATWPYDSFNVEDLDTVDRGVKVKLDEYLREGEHSDWRLLITHNLGLDHAGHRYGTSHPELTRKLRELDEQVSNILASLPDDALFILMGDHGMDAHGDHGGDGELETGAGLFLYSKSSFINSLSSVDHLTKSEALSEVVPSYKSFSPMTPRSSRSSSDNPPLHRSVEQIDFVPTFALLHGLPIPFSSLGSIIPELFPDDMRLRASRMNALQIRRYLAEYAKQSPDFRRYQKELDGLFDEALRLDKQRSSVDSATALRLKKQVEQAYFTYNRFALARAKEVWARFDYPFMVGGLVLLVLSLVSTLQILRSVPAARPEALLKLGQVLKQSSIRGLVGGAGFGAVAIAAANTLGSHSPASHYAKHHPVAITLTATALCANVLFCLSKSEAASQVTLKKAALASWVLFVGLHVALMGSNSFIVWEDTAVSVMLQGILVLRFARTLRVDPMPKRVKMSSLTVASILAVRFMSSVRVCREEQAPQCRSTFYSWLVSSEAAASPALHASGSSTTNSIAGVALAYTISYALPSATKSFLKLTQSRVRLTDLFINWIFRPTLMMGAGHWALDTLSTQEQLHNNNERILGVIAWAKLALARFDICVVLAAMLIVYPASPLPLELKMEEATNGAPEGGPKQRATILGFRNVLGTSYLAFVMFAFSALFLLSQPMGQVCFALSLVIVLCLAELGADEAGLPQQKTTASSQPQRAEDESQQLVGSTSDGRENVGSLQLLSIALLGHLTFFSTGHQATIPSIQWRLAFVGLRQVTHPISGVLVAINSFAPLTLWPALAVTLLVLWQRAPRPRGSGDGPMPTFSHLLRAAALIILWQVMVTTASAVFAVHFRRHLMLFKIWAPRYMLAGVSLVGIDLCLLLSVAVAAIPISKAANTFGAEFGFPHSA